MRGHVDWVGVAFVAYGAAQLVVAGAVTLALLGVSGALVGAGLSPGNEDLVVFGGVYSGLGALLAGVAVAMALPNVIVGVGLRRRIRWSWFGGLACAALALASFPVGTLLGVWAFATLLDREVDAEFRRARTAQERA